VKELLQKIVVWIMALFGKEATVKEALPPFSDYYIQKVDEYRCHPTTGKIILVGDSVTEGQSNYAEYFVQKDVVNRGISGDTTLGVLARQYDLLKEHPKKLFLLIGTNNFGWGTQEAADRVVQDILTLANTFCNKGTKVYVQSILPVHTGFTLTQHRDKAQIAKTNLLLAAYANQIKTFTFVDLYSHFVGEGHNLQPHLTTDGLHLSLEGYKKWGEIITPLMD